MSYATSRPIVNRFLGGADFAAAMRTHLLANVPNRNRSRMKVVAQAVRATSATVRMHPVRLARVMRRGYVAPLVLDLVN